MGEDTLKHLVIGFILITLVGVLILSSVNELANEYDMNTTEVLVGSLDYNKFYGNASVFEEDMKDLKQSFDKQNVWSAIAGVVVEGIFGIGKDIVLLIFSPFDLIMDILQDVFKVPPIVTSILLAILIIIIIMGVWQLIKVGN
jgi:hypothetical protein